MLSLTSATSGYSATSTSSFKVSVALNLPRALGGRHTRARVAEAPCCLVASPERPQPEREAGGDGDLQRHPVPAGGHAAEIL